MEWQKVTTTPLLQGGGAGVVGLISWLPAVLSTVEGTVTSNAVNFDTSKTASLLPLLITLEIIFHFDIHYYTYYDMLL